MLKEKPAKKHVMRQLRRQKNKRAENANLIVQEAHQEQEEYDTTTMNGINQGAFIDCTNCD